MIWKYMSQELGCGQWEVGDKSKKEQKFLLGFTLLSNPLIRKNDECILPKIA